MKFLLAVLCCFTAAYTSAQQTIPLNTWIDHLPYRNAKFLEQDNERVFCATPVSLYSVDKSDISSEKISKCTGLSDIGFTALTYDHDRSQLVIAYDNSNLDLWTPTKVVNIPDIKRKNMVGDKSIYSINVHGNYAYLSCGFGIVVLDLDKKEIKDTYYIGPNGNDLKVNKTAVAFGKLFAATNDGLYVAELSNPAINNFQEWERWDTTQNLPHIQAHHVLSTTNGLYVTFFDRVFRYDSNQWTEVYSHPGFFYNNVRFFNNALYFCERNSSYGQITIMNPDSTFSYIGADVHVQNPMDVTVDENNRVWIADFEYGMSVWSNGFFNSIYPNGPYTNSAWRIDVKESNVYVASGVPPSGSGLNYRNDGFFIYQNNEWKTYNNTTNPILSDSLLDFSSITHNTTTGKTYVGAFDGGSGGGGVVEKDAEQLSVYKQGYLLNDPAFQANYPVYDVITDNSGNVWVSNPAVNKPIHVLTPSGEWHSFQLQNLSSTISVADIYPDNYNRIWVLLGGSGIDVFEYGSDLVSTTDDQFKRYTTGVGTGNLPSNTVLDMVFDLNDEAWIGTDHGIAVIYCVASVIEDGCDAQQIIVSGSDSIAGYLLETERINAIAIDPGNRKWVGTENGVWLLSADGLTELHHFTVDNSPLFSNSILDVQVDDQTGLVYIATARGLIAYQSDAITPVSGDKRCEASVFPNPVKHDYSGSIAIRGVPYNATVKIIDVSGDLVYQTKANGGMATWDGIDYKGQRASSGVYYVTSVSADGVLSCRAKLVFIN